MEYDWSPQQKDALQKIDRWRRSGDQPWFLAAGYAGTGKTTMAKSLVNEPGVLFAAYTGKAAHVLREKGLPATTIHRLIYQPHEKCMAHLRQLKDRRKALLGKDRPSPDIELAQLDIEIAKESKNVRKPDFSLNMESPLWGASLLVVDEYSMVSQQLGEDLLAFNCPILALGDPGQLPPVNGDCFFRDEPDVMLTEIHRQARDNPIIRLATEVREGGDLKAGTYGESRVIRRSDIGSDDFDSTMLNADQVLVGTNRTRKDLNLRIRDMLGRKSRYPEPDDKIVCLRNNSDEGLFNGQTWYVVESKDLRTKGRNRETYLEMSLTSDLLDDDAVDCDCVAHKSAFITGANQLDPEIHRLANEFEYGYALTVHKSQGSEWDSIFLLDEWFWEKRDKWLYTAITRAAKRMTIIQG
jgi:exodeoxyribonuclease V